MMLKSWLTGGMRIMDASRFRFVGWIGLGKMGLPICRRLTATGIEVTVFARNDAGAGKAETEGFSFCRSLEDLAKADVVVSAVPDDAAFSSIMTPDFLEALRPGQIYIDISTVSPSVSTEIARKLLPTGVDYLRVPVSGSTSHAASGQLTAMVSGPRSAFDDAQPLLSAFSAKQFYLGPEEQARYLKLAINSVLAGSAALVAEALAIGEAGGLSRSAMLDVMTQSAIASPLLGYKKEILIRGEYAAAFSVSQIIKDLDLVLGAAGTDHIPVPVNSIVRQRFEQAYAEGLGEADFFCLSGSPKI
jgi:3-hydroxyisobutyrate dehydrogenase-like beta-hydroxyacid dehydrogenase